MDVCRLCLHSGGQNVANSNEILKTLKDFFSYLNTCLKHLHLQLCEVCLKNVDTLIHLNKTIEETDTKIKLRIKNSNSDKINLINMFGAKNRIGKEFSVCRICLNITIAQVFLYDNDINILRHDLILNMLTYCKMMLKCDSFEKPIMCLQCWENLQICYSFKKNYLETNRKIQEYFECFKISKKLLTDEILNAMSRYFSEHLNEIVFDTKTVAKNEKCPGVVQNNKGYYLRKKKIRKNFNKNVFYSEDIKEENYLDAIASIIPKRSRHYFTSEDDDFLLNSYLEVMKNETCSSSQYSSIIQKKWMKKFPSIPLKVSTINYRLKTILKRTDGELGKRKNVSAIKKVEDTVGEPPIDDLNLDSDDSFENEVLPASFLPQLKVEPLSDNDETYVIESMLDPPPSETESDTDSMPIPLLERMDVLPLGLKIMDTYSVETKRETLNLITNDANVVEDYNAFKRITIKHQNYDKTIYKCLKCNFETKYQYSASRHSNWHSDPKKKGFKCMKCTFVTSKYFLLKEHLSTKHLDTEDSNDVLPVLVPFTITY